jgi:hypothetical protein
MTTTFNSLDKWYSSLMKKFGLLMLPHMEYKHDAYKNELNKFLSRANEKQKSTMDNDKKQDIDIMINNIKHIKQTFNKVTEGHCSDPNVTVKRKRQTSNYNLFIKENFPRLKEIHPEWDNNTVLQHTINLYRQHSMKGGSLDDDDDDDIDINDLRVGVEEDDVPDDEELYELTDENVNIQKRGGDKININKWKQDLKKFAL